MLGLCAIIMVMFSVFVLSSYFRVQSNIAEAKKFCELLMPKIETSKNSSGSYPEAVDPTWLADSKIPALIETNHFHLSDGDYYFLRFRVPFPWALENIWGIGSREPNWINYDGDW